MPIIKSTLYGAGSPKMRREPALPGIFPEPARNSEVIDQARKSHHKSAPPGQESNAEPVERRIQFMDNYSISWPLHMQHVGTTQQKEGMAIFDERYDGAKLQRAGALSFWNSMCVLNIYLYIIRFFINMRPSLCLRKFGRKTIIS
jgi:hypothetical protein